MYLVNSRARVKVQTGSLQSSCSRRRTLARTSKVVSIAIYQEEARDATEPPTRHRTIPRATDDGLLNIKGLNKKLYYEA